MSNDKVPPLLETTQSSFQDRSPRLDIRLPVRLFTSEGLYTGVCRNISASGVLVTFEQVIDVWLVGELSFGYNERRLIVTARVARVEGHEAGLSFKPQTSNDHLAIATLLAIARGDEETGDPAAGPGRL